MEEKIHFDKPLMAVLNINLEYLEELSSEQRKKALQTLVSYWPEKDGYSPEDLLPENNKTSNE